MQSNLCVSSCHENGAEKTAHYKWQFHKRVVQHAENSDLYYLDWYTVVPRRRWIYIDQNLTASTTRYEELIDVID